MIATNTEKELLGILEGWMRSIIRDEVTATMKEIEATAKPSRTYTRDEVCKIAHISKPTLWKAVKEGKIRQTKIGRRVVFNENEVRTFIQKI